ncbi:4'-phosphopantetheinyl transferase superfamily protein [Nodosilinea sp. LEGE 07088]|uniref:4'-phosphopantetheinyl transferase family protein n=1 Tax=Nodosilinea sp. LEGE 07088 TaxID=2777968 RepID=UPI0018805FA4|nr:4'-phosphopantetheinyl transferase superfamily protein [Nodosilinea sp. LEGE 07088]MBE9139540.1 4'-phosphopantetheinyl transferase superfamily protein [Nodosilinea sp. LEGE 07088]
MTTLRPGQPHPDDRSNIDIWLLSTDNIEVEALATLKASLSEPEQKQLAKISRPQTQRQFVLSRGCLRHLLSGYTGLPPTTLGFSYGPRGKPSLDQVDQSVVPQFNLSHSGQRLLVAVSMAAEVREIGVDIEVLRPLHRLSRLCRRYLTAAEATEVLALDSPQAERHFLRYWTGKEACLKAQGLGITDSMQSLQLAPAARELTPVLRAIPVANAHLPEHPGQLYQWQPEPGYLAAIAVQTLGSVSIRFRIEQTNPTDLLAWPPTRA